MFLIIYNILIDQYINLLNFMEYIQKIYLEKSIYFIFYIKNLISILIRKNQNNLNTAMFLAFFC